MKVVNTIKLKEEIDYDRLCRKLESQVDSLTSEVERLQKLRDDEKEEMEKQLKNCETHLAEAENQLDIFQLEVDRQKKLRDDDKEQMEKKLKDYEALLSEAEDQVELLKSQINEQKKLRDAERDLMEIKLKELNTLSEAETNFANKYEVPFFFYFLLSFIIENIINDKLLVFLSSHAYCQHQFCQLRVEQCLFITPRFSHRLFHL